MKSVGVIGAGLSGLYAACVLAKNGHDVTVFEKNEMGGGRSRTFCAEGFMFDMGPSWYWMPDVIDKLFHELGENREDYFSLTRLDPAYQVFWKDGEPSKIPATRKQLFLLFDALEENGGKKLEAFLKDAQVKYEVALEKFLENPGIKWSEIINLEVLRYSFKLDILKSVAKDVSKRFKSPKAQAILNFPSLFLGEMPNKIPSLYSLMNYADLELGTWYPEGGMNALAGALEKIAKKFGVKFKYNTSVEGFDVNGGIITGIQLEKETVAFDEIVGAADYNFIEQKLIPAEFRRYDSKYWNKRKMAPSCLIFYIGLNQEIPGLLHHNLFFDEDLFEHGKEIYDHPKWPSKPLFYVSAPSKTDKTILPSGKGENIFILMPIAPGLEDEESIREKYFALICERINQHIRLDIRDYLVYKRSYCVNDFAVDYNSFKGNAYGLANTLMQTANLKPKIKSKLSNLTYCGQLTVPGPGMPAVMISGKIAAKIINEKV